MVTQEGANETLPRGRHGLTREQVVHSQRTRIFRAMAETMAENGYAATSVADVLRAAKVSRETFYEQFESKEDCFMSALEAAVDGVIAAAFARPPADGTPLERFDRGLRTYLDALAEHPARSRLFLIEVYAAGPAALERRTAVQRRFAEILGDTFGRRTASDRFANEAIVAATSSMVTSRLAAGDLDGLRALRRPLVGLARRLHGG
jgi:AcrR family transcriptional regulator